MLRTQQLIAFSLGLLFAVTAQAELRVQSLKCEYTLDPLGVDVAQPRLFWRVESSERGQRQTAYQILVASSTELLAKDQGDLWDSGRVESAETAHVRYAGKPLASSQQVFWKVRSWDRDGKPTDWSKSTTWTMGLLDKADWKGIWIAAPAVTETVLLRKDFAVGPKLRRALVHVTGLGQYEMSLNGSRVGQDLFTPGWTNYDDTALYDTFEVTNQVKEGINAVGLNVGNSMYHVVRRNRFAKFTNSFGPLKAILHLRLEYADGRVEFVGTDDTWRTHAGPNPFASIYGGEDLDARLIQNGWDQPGFKAAGWRPAVPVMQVDTNLRGHTAANEPMREIEVRQPVGVKEFPDGKIIYDFGQNASFIPRLRVSGPAGSSVRLMPAEVVNDDGTIFRDTMGKAHRGRSWWQYTKATDAVETWTPKFFFIGSRYLQAEFYLPGDEKPAPAGTDRTKLAKIDSLEFVIVHASAEPVGQFVCSNPLLNRIRDLVRWAQRSNTFSILTDCPHREKLGWIEQWHLNGPGIRYEWDMARTFTKSMRDLADAQLGDKNAPDYGLVPNIAPEYVKFKGAFRSAAEWGAAFVLVPWQQYQFSGDTELLKTHYEGMKRYVAYLETRTKDNVLSDGLGDWYDYDIENGNRPNFTPAPITATAFLFEDNRTLAEIAKILGKADDAKRYATRAAELRAAQFLLSSDHAHGDIKPDNILVLRSGKGIRFQLLDLGSAAEIFSVTSRAGTPSYLAPERFKGAALSERTEIYAIGVTLYEALSRTYPFGEVERFQTPRFESTPKRPAKLNPATPPWLESIILRAIAPEIENRYQSFSEMAYELSNPDSVAPFYPKNAPLIERNPLLFFKITSILFFLSTVILLIKLLSTN